MAALERHTGSGQSLGSNLLLASLPPDIVRRFAQMPRVVLQPKTVLCELGQPFEHAYFPVNGMVSLLGMTGDAETVELASIGREGVVGLPILVPQCEAPYAVHVQLCTEALKVPAGVLRAEVKAASSLYFALMRYQHLLLEDISQRVVCHRFHTVRQRLCRWLLAASDHSQSNVLAFTQEVIAQTLGVPRTAVTAIAVGLQDSGTIRCRHGRITILSRTRLQAYSCACRRDVSAPLRG